jgi:IS1 family transposase/transposase-like protein
MKEIETSCIKRVGGKEICSSCNNFLIKHGKSATNKARYKCKSCNKTQVENYTYKAYSPNLNKSIIQLTKEGLGIRSTARVLQISTTTLLKRIIAIAKSIKSPPIYNGKVYEVDEMRTYLKRKANPIWLVYALERKTKRVVSFAIGRRTLRTLQNVTNTLLLSNPKRIYTDGLKQYVSLLTPKIHKVKRYGTNQIERNNLSIRTHLKRLNRKTICYSKSFVVLMCVLRIYFWA